MAVKDLEYSDRCKIYLNWKCLTPEWINESSGYLGYGLKWTPKRKPPFRLSSQQKNPLSRRFRSQSTAQTRPTRAIPRRVDQFESQSLPIETENKPPHTIQRWCLSEFLNHFYAKYFQAFCCTSSSPLRCLALAYEEKQLRRITPFPMMSKPTKGSRYLQGNCCMMIRSQLKRTS